MSIDKPGPLPLPEKYYSLSPIIQLQYPIEALKYRISKYPGLGKRIETSLKIAHDKAKESLNTQLLLALEWPETINDYYSYLERFLKFIPHQMKPFSSSSASSTSTTNYIPDHWKIPGQEHQEILDRYCHFCFLIDQQKNATKITEDSFWFRDWILTILPSFGNYFDTTDSFSYSQLKYFLYKQRRQYLPNAQGMYIDENTSEDFEEESPFPNLSVLKQFFKEMSLPQSLLTNAMTTIDPFTSARSLSSSSSSSQLSSSPEMKQLKMIYDRAIQSSGWLTFNQFLTREINPFYLSNHEFTNNGILNAHLHCEFVEKYQITDYFMYPTCQLYDSPQASTASQAAGEGLTINPSPLRHDRTSSAYNFDHIKKLLSPLPHESRSFFNPGKIGQFHIRKQNPHRLYSPIAGIVRENQLLQEMIYFDIRIATPLSAPGLPIPRGFFELIPSNLKAFPNRGYPFFFTKNILYIDTIKHTFGDIGVVGLVTTGLGANNGMTAMNIIPFVETPILKGQCLGTMGYGCFDSFLIFSEGSDPWFESEKNPTKKSFPPGTAMGILTAKRKTSKVYYQF